MQTLTAVRELLEQKNVQQGVPGLVDYLQERVKDLDVLELELQTLRSNVRTLGRKMPGEQRKVHKERINIIEAQITGLHKVMQAIKLGYEPYTPPEGWYGGFLNRRMGKGLFNNSPEDWRAGRYDAEHWASAVSRVFSAPIPLAETMKYRQAHKTGLFDQFIVVSPDLTLFETVVSVFCDPVIVGYVTTEAWRVRFGSIDRQDLKVPFFARGGQGFKIAQWDLQKDRKAAGLDF